MSLLHHQQLAARHLSIPKSNAFKHLNTEIESSELQIRRKSYYNLLMILSFRKFTLGKKKNKTIATTSQTVALRRLPVIYIVRRPKPLDTKPWLALGNDTVAGYRSCISFSSSGTTMTAWFLLTENFFVCKILNDKLGNEKHITMTNSYSRIFANKMKQSF